MLLWHPVVLMFFPILCVTELDMAIAYWNIVMKESFRFLDIWCTFLRVRTLCAHVNNLWSELTGVLQVPLNITNSACIVKGNLTIRVSFAERL